MEEGWLRESRLELIRLEAELALLLAS